MLNALLRRASRTNRNTGADLYTMLQRETARKNNSNNADPSPKPSKSRASQMNLYSTSTVLVTACPSTRSSRQMLEAPILHLRKRVRCWRFDLRIRHANLETRRVLWRDDLVVSLDDSESQHTQNRVHTVPL